MAAMYIYYSHILSLNKSVTAKLFLPIQGEIIFRVAQILDSNMITMQSDHYLITFVKHN